MATREIPRDEWAKFFDDFSQRHQGWLVTVRVLDADIGAQVEAEELPLVGITAELEHSDNRISIMVGETPAAHVTHTITEPTAISIKQTEEGATEALEIKSADGAATLVRFRSAMLPEMVDGVVA